MDSFRNAIRPATPLSLPDLRKDIICLIVWGSVLELYAVPD
jgi:hypothetical protein